MKQYQCSIFAVVAVLCFLTGVQGATDEKGSNENATSIQNPSTITPSATLDLSTPQSTQAPSIPVEETSSSRRQVTFDQRQEGQYNIRADLENFMIVVIPPNPTAGVNLLDLLTRSSLKRSNSKKSNKKNHLLPKFGRPLKNDQVNLGYLSRTYQQAHHPLDPMPVRYSDFIEGRTPYRVDISSSESDLTRIHPDPQVDVLPPPYPLHLHLMKPFHLEAEPTVVQSPAVIQPQQGKLVKFISNIGGRVSKSIKDQQVSLNEMHANRVVVLDDEEIGDYDRSINSDAYEIPNYVDLSNDQFTSTLFDSLNLDDYDEYKSRTAALDTNNENWELKLIGATEQCGPDRKRDSYGICRFVSNIK